MINCPYCGKPAEMVTGDVIYRGRPDLWDKNFWNCTPCGAYVGTHEKNERHGFTGVEPLGRLANADLRRAKSAVHRVFDPIWNNGAMKRAEAYRWLADALGRQVADTHIGMFDIPECDAAIAAIGRRGKL